jgi:hypothetical protein
MFANDTAWLASNGNIQNLFEDANTELSKNRLVVSCEKDSTKRLQN